MSLDLKLIYSDFNFTMDKSSSYRVCAFGEFRLDTVHLMLYRDTEEIPLPPKAVETLLALVKRRGEIVGKDELMEIIWTDAVVEESNIAKYLHLLRKTLGNQENGKPFIETFRRRGYRFNGEVKQLSDNESLVAKEISESADDNQLLKDKPLNRQFKSQTSYPRQFLTAAVVLSGMFLLTFAAARFFQKESKDNQSNTLNSASQMPLVKLRRLTPELDIDGSAISPDSKYLAYDLIEKNRHSLWLKDLTNGGATQIMPPVENGMYVNLVFSPDGTQIYYESRPGGTVNYTLYRIPVFGGEPQKIAENIISPITVSSDGKQVAFVSDGGRLIVVGADGGGTRVLARRGGKKDWYESWGSNLSFSPDGTRIAICGGRLINSKVRSELIIISVADGAEQNIQIPNWHSLDDAVWLSDQSALLIVARETEVSPFQVWRVAYPNGEARRVTNDTNDYDDLSLSADSRFLVIRQKLQNLNLWSVSLDDMGRNAQLTFGNAASDGKYGVASMPDGRIIFTSSRGGNVDLWIMNADGNGQTQLTKNNGEFNGRPRAAPDGKTIIFVSSRTGTRQIWRMDADGGNPQMLTDVKAADYPCLSPDGEWIYFNIFEDEKISIAKIPAAGGEILRIKESEYFLHPDTIAPDGKKMFFGYYDENARQPWKNAVMSLENGEILKIFEDSIDKPESWTVDSKAVFCILGNETNLSLLPVDGGKPRQITNFGGDKIRNFAVASDFRKAVVSRGNSSAEAILMSGF